MLLGEGDCLCIHGSHLVGKIELVGKKRRFTFERIASVYRDAPLLGLLETAKKSKECGFSHSVLSKKAVDIALRGLQGDVFQYRLRSVAESQIVNCDHIVRVY